MGMMTMAKGTSHIRETIFENRFMHVQELARLGAEIHLHGDMAEVRGVKEADRSRRDGNRPSRFCNTCHRWPCGGR